MNSPVVVREAAIGASEAAARRAQVLLVRIASGGGREAQISRDLHAFVPGATSDAWNQQTARLIATLLASGQIERHGDTLHATPAGQAAAAAFLGSRKAIEHDWPAVRDGQLIARALGLHGAAALRLKALTKVDNLSALIVETHWKLKIKGKASTTRLRQALALVALERAFGNQIKSELGAKSALSAKASRLLAGQLAKKPRDFRTDARLVAGLAMEAVGARRSDIGQLRTGILARFLTPDAKWASEGASKTTPDAKSPSEGASKTTPDAKSPSVGAIKHHNAPPSSRSEIGTTPSSVPAPALLAAPVPRTAPIAVPAHRQQRPDPQGFAHAVKAAAAATAEGWPGNRRAFVSLVWAKILERHPEWGVTEIEFKAMLVETHRLGLVVLVNADLKDKAKLATVEASAVSYKNTVWHYVRVEE